MTLAVAHSTPADGTFSAAGATAWNANHTLVGTADVAQGGTGTASYTAGQILFGNGTSPIASTSNLLFDNTNAVLKINGAPTGATTAHKLQVNGSANIAGVEYTGTTIKQLDTTAALTMTPGTGGFTLNFPSASGAASAAVVTIGGGASSGTEAPGDLTFSAGGYTGVSFVNGGNVGIDSGSTTVGSGGIFFLSSGSGPAGGGDFFLGAGSGTTGGNGGAFNLGAGSGGSGGGDGGLLSISAGAGVGAASLGGDANIAAGLSPNGPGGNVNITPGLGNGGTQNGAVTIYDANGTTVLLSADSTNRVSVIGGASFLRTNTALTNYAAAAAGTLNNAPAAGNPSKWIAINDNGTIRKIPTWL
jgi:hypothetical protein